MVRGENFALLVLRRVGLCVGQNQMCKMCGWQILFSWVGSCVAKLVYGLCRDTAKLSAEFGRPKSLVKMSKVDGLVVWLMVVVSSFRLACNGFGLAEGGEFEIRMFKFTIMLNRIPNVEACNSAPLLANPCYKPFFFCWS